MIKIDNNKLNNANEATELKQEITELQTIQAIEARVENTYETIVRLRKDRNKVLQIKNPATVVRALAKLGYVAGSKVGIITNLIEVSMALTDSTYNRHFLLKGSETAVDMFKLGKVFTCVGDKKASTVGYEEIFTLGNNKVVEVTNTQDRTYKLIVATKADIQLFVNRLSDMVSCTLEDLVRIGRDLEKIGRVMQELEIDSAKDATKKDGMKEITEFMASYTCKMASKNMLVVDNFAAIVANKKADAKNKKDDVVFKYEIEDYISLEDMDAAIEEAVARHIKANPNQNAKEQAESIDNIKEEIRKEALIECPLAETKSYMVAQQAKFFEELVALYNVSDMTLFEEFKDLNVEVKDAAVIEEIRNMARTCFAMVTNHLSYSKNLSMDKLDELATTLRNAYYTFAATKSVEASDAFAIACNVAWEKKTAYKGQVTYTIGEDFKYFQISTLFETELKWHLNKDAMETIVEVEMPEGLAIAPNTAFQFVEGTCDVVLPDGTEDFLICLEEVEYTGVLIARIVNGAPAFVKYHNEFEYEVVEFIMFDAICDTTKAENTFVSGQSTKEELVVAASHIIEESTYGKDEAMAHLIAKTNAERNGKIFAKFSNLIELSVKRSDNYGLFQNAVEGRAYLSIKQLSTNSSKMIGRVLGSYRTQPTSQYGYMKTIVNGAGAITILK